MLDTRKCDRAKGFGVRVDLDVTSDGKSIIIFTQTTILNNSVDFVSKEETFQMWVRRRASRDAILDLEWRIPGATTMYRHPGVPSDPWMPPTWDSGNAIQHTLAPSFGPAATSPIS
jgi:hypothetical protein